MILQLPKRTASTLLFLLILLASELKVFAQSGTEFWLAPPEITNLHNSPGGEPLYVLISSTGQASTVTIEQPANGAFVPIVVNVAADKSTRVNLTAFKSQLETRPTDTVLNTGLHITSTTSITCYYQCANTNNTDIWALKGPNAEGTEFYIPLPKHAPFYNEASFAAPHQAYASFDICATQNNTVVTIYSPTPVDGHPALQQFTVLLNRGQTYSCGFTGTNWSVPSTHPAGAIVLANYPITVSLKDDSVHNPSGGCYDIIGDQIVPVDVVGEDYVAVKGSLNNTGDESVVLMATQNNTQVFVDGNATPLATLFAGEYFRIDIDSLSTSLNNALYVHCTKPTYAMHITGFGCEMGMAQLPPLNCAGSQQLNFLRDDAQTFYITVLCRTPAIGAFTVTGSGTATIPASAFVTVPGTGGGWQAAKITYNTTQVPVDSTFKVSNSIDVFALGVVNGGATTGCKYGYFSEFVAPIVANAGVNQTACANTTATLAGAVSGGTISGIWSSSGTGSFTPNSTTLNAIYTPSAADAAVGSVVLTLTSTGACTPVSDAMTLTVTPAPTAVAGADQSMCSNNANTSLSGSVTVASGGVWTGGAGTFIPANNVLNPVYVPTASEISSGSVALTLTTTGNGICNPVSDNIVITFTPSPIVNAGTDQTKCGNNAATTLSGSITVATGGVWIGGGGSFVPSATSLNPVYTPSPSEISAGSVTLTLMSTGNLNCNSVSDQVTIFFSAPPTVSAGVDQTKCANNAATTLAGNVTGATGGQWTGGLGTFSPSNNIATATYTPTAGEISSGSSVLTFTSTGNGTCNAVADQMTLFFTAAPTVNAGPNQTVCANNPQASLSGSFTIASGAIWTGGTGVFAPSNTSMTPTYTPSASEITAGSVTLTLTTTGNGTCNQVSDQVLITITAAPTVNAGPDQTRCGNNAAATLAGNITIATGGTWTGGAGTFNPSSSSLNAVYTPTASEISSGSVTLTLTSAGNGGCNAVSDQVTIFFSSSPTANAGIDQVLCANNAVATLAGNVTVAGGGQWSGGLGIFLPNNSTLNATYTPTSGEILSGSITLTLTTTANGSCTAVADQVTISFTPAPTVNAGSDQTVCGNNAMTTLSGSFTTATGAIWSGGSGSFIPNNTSMNVSYTPSPSEISNGSVTLTLTSTGNGTCTTVSDQVVITITPAPTTNAGTDQTRCANNAAATLSGSISVATGGTWSGGAGTFNPSSSSLNAVYTPTALEISNGSVTLTLTSTGNGICNAVNDQMTISYASPPTASAGSDQTLCGNNAITTLIGNVTGATGGQWSGGLGIFSPNNSTLNASYTPTAGEISSGSITLTLTTTGNGGCNSVSDQVIISYTPAPTVNAGNDQTVCANNALATLSGAFTIASGIAWSGGSGTFTPNNTSVNATYMPTPSEISNGSVNLILTTTGNGTCTTVSDQVVITITPSPAVNAGIDMNRCANNATASLAGTISVATGGTWTGGAGTFTPSSSSLNAVYTPTALEIANGSLTLTLTSTGNGICYAVSDQVTIFYSSEPTITAGLDQTLCGNNAVATMAGNVTTAFGGQWSGGLGIFSPNNNTLNATYTPTASEVAGGNVTLTLTTTGNGGCNAVTDAVTLFFTPAPTVNAGTALTSCANNAAVTLNGSFTVAAGAVWSGGNGAYAPNNTSMSALYTPTVAEIASGSLTLTLTSTGNGTCLPVSDQVILTINPAPLVNAGSDQVTCINNLNVGLSGSVAGPTNTGIWSTSGTGTFVPNNTTLNATYQCSAADVTAGGVTITLTSTGNGSCNAVSDQSLITILPPGTAAAGNDLTVCGNNAAISLNGSVGGGASSGIWGTTGTGSFIPNNSSLNTTYSPTSFDILNGGVTLYLTANSCNTATDSLDVTITQGPVTDAGEDQIVCSDVISAPLSGSVSGGSTSGIWTTSGSGTFSPSNSTLNATYTPSASDVSAQNIYLILTSTSNGQCLPVSDTMMLSIYPAGTSSAGADQILCANNADVSLSGSLGGGATQGQWSTSGSGVFVPSNTTLNAVYEPSSADITNGSVTISLTATNSCNAATDDLNVTFTPAPTADAGEDITSCANNSSVVLDGSFTIATGAIWTGGNGTFSPNSSSVTATYFPTAIEISNGSVTLILTTDGNGTCLPVADDVVITIVPSPVVNAGVDQETCVTDLNVALSGSVQGVAVSGQWSTSGTGTFSPSNTALNAVYQLSAQDSIDGSITLTLTSTNNLSCLAVSDVMSVSVVPASITTAGNDVVVCANNATVNLNGTVSGGASSGIWGTTGTGTFFPDNTSLNSIYIPSQFDIANGGATIHLTSSTCTSSSDSLTVSITPAPIVDAGADETICAYETEVQLNATISGATTTGIWTTSGSGTFSPSNTALNAIYQPSAADVAAQNIELVLTSSNNGLCVPVSDTLALNIYPIGSSSAGSDQILCANNPNVILDGSLGGGATQGAWNTTGSGFFIPNNTALDATYVPSQGDLLSGSVILGLTATNSCNSAVDFLIVSFSPAPMADAGAIQSVCGDNASFILNGSISNAAGGIWSGGSGTFTPNNTSLNATYTPSIAEASQGFAVLTLSSTGNGNCNAVSDTVSLYISSGIVVNAGVDQEVCITAPYTQMQGIVSNGSSTGMWSTLGSGSFSPDQNALNALYTFSLADIAAESVTLVLTSTNNGSCPVATDTLNITFGQSAFAYAGNDQSVCSSSEQMPLNGFVTGGATQGMWTTSGNGTFSPDNTSMIADYTFTASDVAAGQVTFILTTTDNGSCLPGIDTLVYTINPESTVNVGGDMSVCADDLSVPVSGNITGASTSGIWTSLGSGTFMPDNTSLNATYVASASDSIVGFVSLILTSTNTGACSTDADTLLITIHEVPTVNAGTDQTICSSTSEIALNGIIAGGASTGIWTATGNGSFSPGSDTLSTIYNITASDIAAGEVSFVLTTTDEEACAAVSDTVVYTITENIIVNAGSDFSICSTNLSVPLAGNITGASSGGTWSTSGSGTFTPDDSTLSASYIPGANDSLVGNVTLVLTSTAVGSCLAESDTMLVTIASPSFADAGADQSMCSVDAAVNLNGLVTGGSISGVWNSTGSGTFNPNTATLNATYTPSSSDLANGSLSIMLTTTGNGICTASTDVMNVTFAQPPLVNAGPDRVLCDENTEVALNGIVLGSVTTGIWTSDGSGTFGESSNVLNNSYTLSAADLINSEVMIILTSTNNTLCDAVSDTIFVTVQPLPVAAFSAASGDVLDVQFTDESIGAASWLWDFEVGGSSTEQNPLMVYPEIGSYFVTLTILSSAGCADTTSALVEALEPIGTPVAIPSGFSPNGDASNDVLHVLGGPFKQVDFRIYNEWGNLVFSTTDPNGGWDGTYKGEHQPGGVYVYTASGITVKDRYVRLSGNVTLIR